jgi:hypothetical protein
MDHNLEYPWTLYVTKQRTVQGFEKSIKEWEDRLEKINVFNTAESFWCVYNNIRLPSEMKNERGDYYLFKDEILPEWEHPRNVGGGSIVLNFDPFKADDVWLRIQLEVIGNNFPRLDVVCGLELAIRKNRYKIAVWVDNSKNSIVRELAEELKKIIHVISVEFRRHETGDKLEFTIK